VQLQGHWTPVIWPGVVRETFSGHPNSKPGLDQYGDDLMRVGSVSERFREFDKG